ncbi:hypothetical protein BSU01_14490 [Erwinia billingiae]|uniref:glycine-rich domain-containing protein n=1 Tax=Erwinia billingiae TaxID=182337 RepID=UPI0019CF9D0F|nr:phage tail protein [Erwinia billingiae]MBN7122909.1 hypothetical protein [Erwinia billingiae]
MDRQIIYPGAIPLETDLLNTNKYAMMGLAKLSSAMMGSTTYLHGLACTPSSPASMVVNVARGQIYSLQNVDGTAYSSLAADTVNTILKQGVILNSTTFTLTAPTTAGQSINYLIQATYSDTDSGATTLPYYNAANPSVAYSGPNNSGTAQNTVRSGVCTLSLKAGVAATTGTQTTPAVDTGFTAAWVITVAQGATTVTAANINLAVNAPFLPASGLIAAIQQCTMTYAADTGAANAYAAQYVPALPTLVDGMRLTFKAKTANTGSSTFAANGGSAYPLYSHANQALQGGEIIANGLIEVEWTSTLMAWVMCGNSGGALPVAPATQSNNALQLGQATGRLLNVQTFTSSGTYTPTAGTTSIIVEVQGAGGGAGGIGSAGSSTVSIGNGGGAGAYAKSRLSSGFSGVSVSVGIGGTGGNLAPTNGSTGGSSSFGTIVALGGGGGLGQAQATPPFGATGSAGGVASGGNILNTIGMASAHAFALNTTSVAAGHGGTSVLGTGGFSSAVNGSIGTNGYAYGGGGGGGYRFNGSGFSGGTGASGVVIIWEYA